jgi:D-alanyl-D-alanine carboxypeptidase/D-alanyl-D-alanine-endopeptidase (penicillin-binding protein 4)
MRRAGVVLLALLVVLLPASASAGSRFCEQLRSRLVSGGGGASGLLAVDADSGQVVCARAAGRVRPLASNTKLFTTSAALSRFGPEYRIETKLLTDGSVDGRGVLHGSLYLQGGGDPALGSPAFYDRYLGGVGTNLFALKAQLRSAGVRSVTGRLYADDGVFDRLRGVADSGYATSPYIGPLSGLGFNAGYTSTSLGGFAADPARLAAAKLARAIRKSGVSIRARVALRPTPPGATTLATVLSPTMGRLVQTTDVYSHNFFAEMLLKLLGSHFGGTGSTRAGTAVVERFARAHGSGVHAVDGSGLTRSNRASPRQVVGLLLSMRASPVGERFVADLALAGHTGTVAHRMDGTAADGRCRTKTGTLTGVSNLSGYCFNRDGKTIAFSILMGGVHDLYHAHREQDRIAALLSLRPSGDF